MDKTSDQGGTITKNNLISPTKQIPQTTKNTNAPSLKNNTVNNGPVSILSLLCAQNYVPLDINNLNAQFNKYDSPRISSRSLTEIRAYAANTNQGIVR